jgi:protein-L-isoaspartate(D-aspartate) O-methyltransferase
MAQRPSFPARIDLHSGKPTGKTITPAPTPKTRAAPVAAASGNGLNPLKKSPMASAVALAPVSALAPRGFGMDSAAMRGRLVQHLANTGISSKSVLQAIGTVERHRFVDTALVNQAYEDTSLPIGLGQTISKPNVVARMIELLLQSELASRGPLTRVLEIGTGCGYQAAVLAELVREVYSIERLRGLHEKARANLRPFKLANVHLLLGDGMLGYPKGGPYAGIISAAGGEAVPQAWLEQLAVGGRLVAPTVTGTGQQALVVVDRTVHGLTQQVLEAVHFVPLKSGIA